LKENLEDLKSLEKTAIAIELRAKYKLCDLLEFLQLPASTYYDNVKVLTREPKYQEYDKMVYEYILNNPNICGKKGYREVMSTMKDDEDWTEPISERRIRKVMKDNGLLAYQTKSMKPYNSYKNDGNPPAKNWLYDENTQQHFFDPKNIWEILGTDVTEFHINGYKTYLSLIIDFKGSMPVTWKISKNPNTELIVGTVHDLLKIKPDGGFILHMDQGSVNRSHAMKEVCKQNHILQSMSRKGQSGDNAPTEGFFGRLKQEWFDKTDFTNFTYEMFVDALNDWLNWCCDKRHNSKLGGLTPKQFRALAQKS
jgi:transposase InsO family protein